MGLQKTNLGKIRFLKKNIFNVVKKQFSRRDLIGLVALGETLIFLILASGIIPNNVQIPYAML